MVDLRTLTVRPGNTKTEPESIAHAEASKQAILAYAKSIEPFDAVMAKELRIWVGEK